MEYYIKCIRRKGSRCFAEHAVINGVLTGDGQGVTTHTREWVHANQFGRVVFATREKAEAYAYLLKREDRFGSLTTEVLPV